MRRLLIRPGAIGDFIVSLPAMEALRTGYTEIWCAEQNVPLAKFADRARSIGSAGLNRIGVLNCEDVIHRLRTFDSILSWSATGREELTALGLPITFLQALPDPGTHAVAHYNRQARDLGGKPSWTPSIPCPARPRTFGVVHPFASSPVKRAPLAVFESAANRLAPLMPVHWLVGPQKDLPRAIRIPDLYDLARWLAGARPYVWNDS